MKFVDVKNDIAFRKIFGNENKKEILISFLNAVLDSKGSRRVVDVDLSNPYQFPIVIGAKATILDIKAKDQNGNNFIVEMQVTGQSTFFQRAVFYSAKSYSSQLDENFEYEKLKPVIFIGIMNFNLLSNPHYISKHLILDATTHDQEFKDLDFNFIELRKFDKEEHELETLLDKWIYFIKHAKDLEVIPPNINDKGLTSAYTVAAQHQWTKEELEVYDSYKMKEADERAIYKTAVEKGLQEGLERGLEKGLEKGKGIGLEEGKKQKSLAIAKNLLAMGLDDSSIAQATGLSIEEVKLLRN